MDARTTANLYYDAWLHRAGDMTGVPLAEDFAFRGPVASFDTAEGFRAMAREAGAAVRSFRVRHQFADGDMVCSIIDWEMAMLPGVLTAAELLEVRDGRIVRGELIYDAEELRRAMAGPTIVELLERSFRDTADMLERVDETGWTAPSRCSRWTVRQAGNHLVGGIAVLTKIVNEEPIDPDEVDAQKTADTDHLGSDPATAFREAAQRCVAAFARPGMLDRRFALPAPDMPGLTVANICLVESLVHGWDIASGADVIYKPDDAVVAAVRDWAFTTIDDARRGDNFGPAIATPADADPFTATLGHLGRRSPPAELRRGRIS